MVSHGSERANLKFFEMSFFNLFHFILIITFYRSISALEMVANVFSMLFYYGDAK